MEDWKEYKLGDVLTIKYGKDHKQIADGDIPIYGSGGIMRYGELSLYDGPSILIPRKGSLNNIMFANNPFWTVDTMFWTIINEDIANPLFVYYSICKKDLASLNVGSAVPSLTVPVIEDIDILLPSKETQNRIVAILKSLDAKIEVNRWINDNFYLACLEVILIWLLTSLENDNLEKQAQALFKSWFVDFDPFKDGEFVESELGMIPKGWRAGTLSEIANITMGTSPSGASYNVNGEGEVFYQGRAEFGYRFPHRNMYTTEPKRYAEDGDVLLSVRAPVGDVNIANERCCIGRGLAAIGSESCPSYILYLVKSLKSVFEQYNGEGTVFGSINKKTLEGLRIIVPESKYIERFEKVANPLDGQIRCKEEESRRLASLRDTLLPKLMSGELKLNEVNV